MGVEDRSGRGGDREAVVANYFLAKVDEDPNIIARGGWLDSSPVGTGDETIGPTEWVLAGWLVGESLGEGVDGRQMLNLNHLNQSVGPSLAQVAIGPEELAALGRCPGRQRLGDHERVVHVALAGRLVGGR